MGGGAAGSRWPRGSAQSRLRIDIGGRDRGLFDRGLTAGLTVCYHSIIQWKY